MSRIVYVNGAFLAEEEAKISVFDRGFIFADGIYEVSAVLDGGLVDNEAHLARLARSLGEIDLADAVAQGTDRRLAKGADRAQPPRAKARSTSR